MVVGCSTIKSVVLLLAFAHFGRSLEIGEFYDFDRSTQLENGVDKSTFIKLDTPINFFSDIYDHIYINTQGILTFGIELPSFYNVPFPLEYPAIAPFYSNVDTTNAGPETSISFSTLQTESNRQRAYETVRRNFPGNDDFRVVNVYVATWENVGHFKENNNQQNTYQVAIICGEQNTFVEFLYPSNGLNWLQGDFGESGLPDVRAQAGFVAEDGRVFTLTGSGSDNVKYLSQLSNHGKPGSWIYRIGHVSFENNIEEPDQTRFHQVDSQQPKSCSNVGRLKCHISAICQDTPNGFACHCKSGFYGNGLSCIKSDVPVRVLGKVTGKIGNTEVNAQLQSYVVLSDGRSYTAVSPLSSDIGFSSQLAHTFGYGIGWLFAKPVGNDNSPNGYQITGGKLNHTISVRFITAHGSDELLIVQRFNGLNVWDQLSVDIDVNGNIPSVPSVASITFPDTSEAYVSQSGTQIRSASNGVITVDGENVTYAINQVIEFEHSPESGDRAFDASPIYNKISKITAQYQEREEALRIGMINKVVSNAPLNPCTDGTASCGQSAVCIPDPENDSYTCECRNGFTLDESSVCVDIDECSTNANVCDENAECYNDLGGYSCRCRYGYIGNGFNCQSENQEEYTEEQGSSTTDSTPSIPALAPEHWLCDQCSEQAECNQGVCVCKNGWNGDGIECAYNCPDDYVWNIDRCEPINSNSEEDEEVIRPFCYKDECSCSTGYDLVEANGVKSCHLVEHFEEEEKLPCDAEDNCHAYAKCVWMENELRSRCVCDPGYEGDGYKCVEHEVSCLIENICDPNAACIYDENVGKSVCKCNEKFEGDGKTCRPAPDCSLDEDCSENSHCSNGACVCNESFERDFSDRCVPIGFCGGAFCATNAVCLWDDRQQVSYCSCPEGFIGDGLQSCKSIPPKCNVRNNCGLNAQCLPVNDSYECVCNGGYYGDGLLCVPELNCRNVRELCHEFAQCIRTSAGYQCVCNTGFIGNGTVCQEPIKQGAGFLLLSQGVATLKVPFDGRGGHPIAISSMAIGVDKDCSTGRVYWSDVTTRQIYSSLYNGSDYKTFISEDILSPEGIAVDWVSRRLYWTDSEKDTIEVASLDDPKVRAVIIKTDLVNPRGIAVDPHQSKLYWSDWNRNHPKIEHSNLDGSNRAVLLSSPSVILPNSLTISPRTGELCYADAGTQKIECVEPYHRSVRPVAKDLFYPFGLAAANEKFYWTDWTTKKIESVDEHGNRYPGISSPFFGSNKMYGITAVTNECPLFFSPCQINNGDCPSNSICLVNPASPLGRNCQSA